MKMFSNSMKKFFYLDTKNNLFCYGNSFLSGDDFFLEGHGASVGAVLRRISITATRRAQMSIHLIEHHTNVAIVQETDKLISYSFLNMSLISHLPRKALLGHCEITIDLT